MKNKVIHAHVGWRAPMLLIQLSPLQWGLGVTFGTGKYGFSLGPLSVVVWTKFDSPFECNKVT